jgi:hypothetical protein
MHLVLLVEGILALLFYWSLKFINQKADIELNKTKKWYQAKEFYYIVILIILFDGLTLLFLRYVYKDAWPTMRAGIIQVILVFVFHLQVYIIRKLFKPASQ